MKLNELLEPGHRKITLTVLAVIGTILLEKFGGGLTHETRTFIRDALLIFTGGNVLSKGIFAMKEIKVSKQQDVVATDFGISDDEVAEKVKEAQLQVDPMIGKIIEHVNKLDHMAGQKFQDLEKMIAENQGVDPDIRFQELSDRLDVQVQNVDKLIKHVQKLGEQINGQAQQHNQPRI